MTKNSEKITDLQNNIAHLKDEMLNSDKVIHKIVFSSTKDILKSWARWLDELHGLGVNVVKSKSGICKHIKDEIRQMDLPEKKKTNLIFYVHHVLSHQYKDPNKQTIQNNDEINYDYAGLSIEGTKSPKNMSASNAKEYQSSFIVYSFNCLDQYHLEFSKIIEKMLRHLEDPKILQDFENDLKWNEISNMCKSLAELQGPYGVLAQMSDEVNLKQSVTIFQKAMAKLLSADKSYRFMAHAFGISTKQYKRLRDRLEDWPKRHAQEVIQRVTGSECCPNCNFNLIKNELENRKESNRDKTKVPREYKGMTPVEAVYKKWSKKIDPKKLIGSPVKTKSIKPKEDVLC